MYVICISLSWLRWSRVAPVIYDRYFRSSTSMNSPTSKYYEINLWWLQSWRSIIHMTRKTIKNEFGIYNFFLNFQWPCRYMHISKNRFVLFQFVIFNTVDKNVISVGTCIKATQNRIKIHVIYVHVCISPLKKCVIFSLQVYHQ